MDDQDGFPLYTTNEWELFDNEKDPKQLRSVFSDPAYADTLTKLKAELEELRTNFKGESIAAGPPEKGAREGKKKRP